MNTYRFTFFRLCFLGCLAALIVGSLMPSREMPSQSINDKFLHFGAYALVGTLAMLSFRRMSVRLGCLVMLMALGVALEFGQTMVPGRAFELWDMAANGMGTIAALVTGRMLVL